MKMLTDTLEKDKSFWIDKLQLRPHPDGGFFTENYRSKDLVAGISSGMANHNASTSIYHLYASETKSFCHKLDSDELWYYHYGSSITIYMIDAQGNFTVKICGPGDEEDLAVLVPKNNWFGARVFDPNSYSLVSCNVAPGFEYTDFQMMDRNELIEQFPQHKEAILFYTLL
jgi:predicted cupin superfamily sugar epimerase